MSLLLLSKVAKKKAASWRKSLRHPAKDPDEGQPRPFGLRLGGVAEFDETPFILATALDPNLPAAPETKQIIEARLWFERNAVRSDWFVLADGETSIFVVSERRTPVDIFVLRKADEIHPADEDDWRFWLSEEDGFIGLPAIETPDGIEFSRIWEPGEERIEPYAYEETFVDKDGASEQVRRDCMMYARPIDPEEADETLEFLLVSCIEADDEAWVEIHRGIALGEGMVTGI